MFNISSPIIFSIIILVGIISFIISPKEKTIDSFYKGHNQKGTPPNLWTLVLSQVTTWIFARSLLNAALLGYIFGIAGALAYSAYYLSFITGWVIIDKLRYKYNVNNIQAFLEYRFGKTGSFLFNILISLRLLTEVFANLLVIGLLFGKSGSNIHYVAVAILTLATLFYSMNGGLRASLRTDVLQMLLIFILVFILMFVVFSHPQFSLGSIMSFKSGFDNKGWILLIVALLQVISYPLHDPVMMDRGFLADRKTTKNSFLYAFIISFTIIFIFGLIGTFAGVNSGEDKDILYTLQRLLGDIPAIIIGLILILSAASTLDSTFSSVSKLIVVDIGVGKPSVNKGRIAMLLFAIGGIALTIWGSKDLFDAVAVSGTVSLALTPIILFSIFLDKNINRWSLILNFALSFAGSIFYFLEKNNKTFILHDLFGIEHGYDKLLIITISLFLGGIIIFYLGINKNDNKQYISMPTVL